MLDILLARRIERRNRAERHRTIAANHALDVRMLLQNRIHRLLAGQERDLRILTRDHLQIRILIEHLVKSLRTRHAVLVRKIAREFDIFALFADGFDKALRDFRPGLQVIMT